MTEATESKISWPTVGGPGWFQPAFLGREFLAKNGLILAFLQCFTSWSNLVPQSLPSTFSDGIIGVWVKIMPPKRMVKGAKNGRMTCGYFGART